MLRGLTTDQCTSGLLAALCHTTDDRRNLFRVVLSACDIVQEEQRLSTCTGNVIHTHGHRVNTDGVMLIQKECQFHLCSAAVRSGKKHRFFHLLDLFQ